jgi:hypothetical protein
MEEHHPVNRNSTETTLASKNACDDIKQSVSRKGNRHLKAAD